MTSHQEIQFIRLFLLSQNISTIVISKYVKLKLLSCYNEDLIQYLNSDEIKHIFHHRWQKCVPCCLCKPEGCTSLRKISHKVFAKFYDVVKNDNHIRDHHKQSGIRITQYCIHDFVPKKDMKLEKLDVYMLLCLLEHCMASLSQQDQKYLEDVRNIRNDICHCKSTEYSENDISIKWADLETALQYLDKSNETKDLIKELKEKTLTLTESEVDQELGRIKDIGRDEDDEGFDIAYLNLLTLKWCAQLYTTLSSNNIELDTHPSIEYLLQTTDSSIACGLEFKNLTNSTLQKPKCKIVCGLVSNPPKSMRPWGNSFVLAHKSHLSINGTSGVASWEIEHKDIRVAVMWSIPSPFSRHKNTLALGFQSIEDSHVFNIMYNCTRNNGREISRAEYSSDCNYISCIEENLEIIGVMGNSQKTVISIELKEIESQ